MMSRTDLPSELIALVVAKLKDELVKVVQDWRDETRYAVRGTRKPETPFRARGRGGKLSGTIRSLIGVVPLSCHEIASKIGAPHAQVTRCLRRQIQTGQIRRIGKHRGVKYVLATKKPAKVLGFASHQPRSKRPEELRLVR